MGVLIQPLGTSVQREVILQHSLSYNLVRSLKKLNFTLKYEHQWLLDVVNMIITGLLYST